VPGEEHECEGGDLNDINTQSLQKGEMIMSIYLVPDAYKVLHTKVERQVKIPWTQGNHKHICMISHGVCASWRLIPMCFERSIFGLRHGDSRHVVDNRVWSRIVESPISMYLDRMFPESTYLISVSGDRKA
jgi:hypothetical protein